jgi:hypothetical protein
MEQSPKLCFRGRETEESMGPNPSGHEALHLIQPENLPSSQTSYVEIPEKASGEREKVPSSELPDIIFQMSA